MDGDFRTGFVREPAALRQYPALVLNADYRPLSYYPLILWPWQEAVKAAWLERVDIVAEYDHVSEARASRYGAFVVVLKRLRQTPASAWPSRASIFSCGMNSAVSIAGQRGI